MTRTIAAGVGGLLAAAFLSMATAFADTADGDTPVPVNVTSAAPAGGDQSGDQGISKLYKVCVPQAVGIGWVSAFRCVLVP